MAYYYSNNNPNSNSTFLNIASGSNIVEEMLQICNINDVNSTEFCNANITETNDANATEFDDSKANCTFVIPTYEKILPYIVMVFYLLICVLGLVGNGLVIYVVLMFAKMKTVTNMYILNLALSDVLFLVILPIMSATSLVKHWVFGLAMCKIYFVLYSINLFGGSFNLCVMSADRYLAVCHPIRSLQYRTPRIALFLCLCIWSLSFLVMMPTILYSTTIKHRTIPGKETCLILWPPNRFITADKAFIWYSFVLGFAIPVSLISVFYVLVIIRLRHVGPARKSKEKQKSHRRVTRLVLTVIAVYVVCWLPYWSFQAHIVFNNINSNDAAFVLLFNVFTVLSFANSSLNPFLYAFLSDNFRKSFVKAFKCMSVVEVNKSTCNENSVFPRTSQTYTRSAVSATAEEKMELSSFDNSSLAATSKSIEYNSTKFLQDDQGFLKPPVSL